MSQSRAIQRHLIYPSTGNRRTGHPRSEVGPQRVGPVSGHLTSSNIPLLSFPSVSEDGSLRPDGSPRSRDAVGQVSPKRAHLSEEDTPGTSSRSRDVGPRAVRTSSDLGNTPDRGIVPGLAWDSQVSRDENQYSLVDPVVTRVQKRIPLLR